MDDAARCSTLLAILALCIKGVWQQVGGLVHAMEMFSLGPAQPARSNGPEQVLGGNLTPADSCSAPGTEREMYKTGQKAYFTTILMLKHEEALSS